MSTVQTEPLPDYLWDMSEKLGCYFTMEDVPTTGDTEPPRIWGEEIEPDDSITTIDDLVAKLDADLADYHAVRSTVNPKVVHLIAHELLGPGYLMDRSVSVDYSGSIRLLPDAIGALVGGEMGAKNEFAIGGGYPTGDWTTEVDIAVENQSVRDVLTGAVPLAEYSTFPIEQYGPWIWQSIYATNDDGPEFIVMFFDSPYAEAVSLWDYIQEMSVKLDCYFTLEDRFTDNPTRLWPRAYDASVAPNIAPAPEIDTIDALVAKLQADLTKSNDDQIGYRVMRSADYPSVIHIIAEDLIEEGYVLDQQVSIDFSGTNQELANQLGTLVDGKIGASDGGIGIPFYPLENYTTQVDVHLEGKTVRDVLTAAMPAVPVQGYSPVLWQAIRTEKTGYPPFGVVFRTNWFEDEEQ